MKATVVGLVTPHLLRIIDLASQAEQGSKVDWHVREAVTASMATMADQYNAQDLVAAYLDGLDSAAAKYPDSRPAYVATLRSAAETARRLKRD